MPEELMNRRRWEELMKTGDGSFVICDFLVIPTKIIQKMLRGKKWKALSASKTTSSSLENRLNRSKHRRGRRTLILSCCKWVLVQQNLWAGWEQIRNRVLTFGYQGSPPKLYAYIFWYNLQPWGKGLSTFCFQPGAPVRRQGAAFCGRPVPAGRAVLTDWGHWKCHSALPHPEIQAEHLNRDKVPSFSGRSWPVHPEKHNQRYWEDAQVKQGRME